jgi:hypothetical protein
MFDAALVAGAGAVSLWIVRHHHEGTAKVLGTMVAAILGLTALFRTARGLWRGGAIYVATPTSTSLELALQQPRWFVKYVARDWRSLALWAIAENPLFPGLPIQFLARPVSGTTRNMESAKIGGSVPPWWIRSRRISLRTVVFDDLRPGVEYEIGAVLLDSSFPEAVVAIHFVPTLSLRTRPVST